MITITLSYTQLEHTIKQVLHRAGERLQDADARYMAQLDGSASDTQLIMRLIRTGVARAKVILKNYLTNKTSTGNDAIGTEANINETYVFGLDLNGDGQSLADLLHWYVCWYAIHSIAPTLGLSDLEEQATGDAAEAESLISSELVALSMPIKARRSIIRPQEYAPIITLTEE